MAGHTSQLAALPDRRIGLLIAPREHGAWGLLLVPLTTGGAVGLLSGGSSLPLMAFTVAALTLLWLRTPVENWLGTGLLRAQTQHERRSVGITIVLLAAVAVSALASLFWDGRHPALVPLGLVAAGAFVGQGLLRKLGRQTRMLSQIVGTLGLTITAPAAYYVVTGELNREAWALWLANFLFAGDQVHFVQLRIHSARLVTGREKLRRGRTFLLGQMLLAVILILAWRSYLLPGLAGLAFVPLLVRGATWFFESQQTLVVRRLGWTELAHAVVFGGLLIAGFHFNR